MPRKLTKRPEEREVTNLDIALALEEIGDLLEIQGGNPFKIRAYRQATLTVKELSSPLSDLVEADTDLTKLPAIGKDIAGYIEQYLETGSVKRLDELRKITPHSLTEIMHIRGLGAKKTHALWKRLGVESIDDLERVATAGEIAKLSGFGAKSQENIREGLKLFRQDKGRFRLDEADQSIDPLVAYMKKAKGLARLEVAGSYRRRKETVGDIDLLAVAEKSGSVVEHFLLYSKVSHVQSKGQTRSTVFLRNGLQVDLRVVPPKSFGAAFVYFTGSKAHNIDLRQRAIKKGLRISEYGVFREGHKKRAAKKASTKTSRDPWSGTYIAGRTEEEVYQSIGLPWIPPELRENRGEVAAAEKNALPKLVKLSEIRGDLQMHSTWSDGKASIRAMVEGCIVRGYQYMALTDHSKALRMTGGLDARRLRKQMEAIDAIAAREDRIRILRSIEVDILGDGKLDLENEVLEELDIVVAAIHSRFNLSKKEQTQRIVRAMMNPCVNILAHPTGRLLKRRAAIEFDVEEVFKCAAEHQVALEINAQPERLDLKDTHARQARDKGVLLVVSTDAHSTANLDLMHYGVEQARRAWATKKDVLNTRTLKQLLKILEK